MDMVGELGVYPLQAKKTVQGDMAVSGGEELSHKYWSPYRRTMLSRTTRTDYLGQPSDTDPRLHAGRVEVPLEQR